MRSVRLVALWLVLTLVAGAEPAAWVGPTSARFYTLRLAPGQDVKQELHAFCLAHHIQAGYLATAVGSLRQARVRFAMVESGADLQGPFEVVSLVGTLGADGEHLHLSLADSQGRTVGGHMLDGCLVNTTLEIVIGAFDGVIFKREVDPRSGFPELVPVSK